MKAHPVAPLRRHHPGEQVLEVDGRRLGSLEQPARTQDLDPHQLLTRGEVECDVVREPHVPALVRTLEQPDMERVSLPA